MPKQKSNPTGSVSVDLFADKKELDRQAKDAGTTGTNLARILIRDGLAKLASGEFKITSPALTATEEVAV
jgi:endonuclease YncB( thermonuclease family)